MAELTKEQQGIRTKRYSEEVRRLESLLRMREAKVGKARGKLADAKDRLELAQRGRE